MSDEKMDAVAAWGAIAQQLEAENLALTKEIVRIAGLLSECAADFDEASRYKGDYLREKHGDAESVARYQTAAAEALKDRPADGPD